MEYLDKFIARKRENAEAYESALTRHGRWRIVREPPNTFGTYWMTIAEPVERENRPVLASLRRWSSNGIGVRPIWHPLHDQPMYRDAICCGGRVADEAYATMFCLPSSVGLTATEIEHVVEVLHE